MKFISITNEYTNFLKCAVLFMIILSNRIPAVRISAKIMYCNLNSNILYLVAKKE